jgi:hypothetical protein
MATTKKPRPLVAPSKPAAANEPKTLPTPEMVPAESEAKEVPAKRVPTRRGARVYRIFLIEGSSYEKAGFSFESRRPIVTTDERVYEAVKNNGRFRIEIREGGA